MTAVEPKFEIGDLVDVKTLAADAVFLVSDEGLETIRETTDRGYGEIIGRFYESDVGCWMYQIGLYAGRFDPHRNDLGELWVLESEVSLHRQH